MYKIELHMHTKYSSGCSCMDEKDLVEGYLAAGYSGVAVTDHYAPHESFMGLPTGKQLERFLEGYRRVKEEGERRGLRVYRGAEVRFYGSENDYLLFDYPDELLMDAEKVFSAGLEKFYPLCREAGALLIQAHPFRHVCQVADHRFLDGVEVTNKHLWWDSHNDQALAYAERWPDLIRTSGSDCHHPSHVAQGGIIAPYLPKDDTQLTALLRSRNYGLIG